MPSPGTRLPLNPIGHTGPGGPPPLPNVYRPPGMPPAMSPSMNQAGPRMYMTNSPGVSLLRTRFFSFHCRLLLTGWRLFFLFTCSLRRMCQKSSQFHIISIVDNLDSLSYWSRSYNSNDA